MRTWKSSYHLLTFSNCITCSVLINYYRSLISFLNIDYSETYQSKIKRKLKCVAKRRSIQRKSRIKNNFKIFALVGYTNAGKTQLFNRLTKEKQKSVNKLFSTLDTKISKVFINKDTTVGLIDTVGFINNIPAQLIESFKATFEEIHQADFIINVVDISDQNYKGKINNTFEDIFINLINDKEDIIFAKEGNIKNENNTFVFQLIDGFKLSIDKNINQIEKLEFKNYVIELQSDKNAKFNNYDRNTLTIFDDINNKDFKNIGYKIFDIILCLLIVFIFYRNNIVTSNLSIKNNLYFIIFSIFLVLTNQLSDNNHL